MKLRTKVCRCADGKYLSGVLTVNTVSTPLRKDTGVFESHGRFLL